MIISLPVQRESQENGSVAEWSKALVLGTSLFGGVGSNPIAAIFFTEAHRHFQ